uniref:Uncharacterized protein n=1 Tax=viral metagenome TaxID=1070528 RepID=A0A6M3LFS1_9ZZZZ
MRVKVGNIVQLTGCNGVWMVTLVAEHHIKVQPEDIQADAIWVKARELVQVFTQRQIDEAVAFVADNGDTDGLQSAIAKFHTHGAHGI